VRHRAAVDASDKERSALYSSPPDELTNDAGKGRVQFSEPIARFLACIVKPVERRQPEARKTMSISARHP
jgi:hypothetical protein